MNVVSLCLFPVLPLLWQRRDGQLSLTVLVKATLRMAHGQEAVVAEAQEAICGERAWPDDPRGGLLEPTDWVPEKPRADLLLVGHAYAPPGTAVEQLVARLEIGGFTKALRVTGDRLWVDGPAGLVPGRPSRFVRMPLRDDLLPAGPGNPYGVPAGAAPFEGWRALPNLEPVQPGTPATGFGPVSPALRGQVDGAGLEWAYRLQGPPPEGFDFAFFNAAPPDQQLDRIPAGTSIRLEHLSREAPVLETRLPELSPRAFVAGAGGGRLREVDLRCDTLLIDADRGLAVLSFRGSLLVEAADWEEGTLGVALDVPGGPSAASLLASSMPGVTEGAGYHPGLRADEPPSAPDPAEETISPEEIADEPSDFGPPPWPPLHEDERPLDLERTQVRGAPSAPVAREPTPQPPVILDEQTAADDGGDFARRTAEMELAGIVRSIAGRPVLPFVKPAQPPAVATPGPLPVHAAAPDHDGEELTRELDPRMIRRAAMPFPDDADPTPYDPQAARPVLPFQPSAPDPGPAPPAAPPPVATHPADPAPYAGPPMLRFPPAPPLGPTPGRFVTTSPAPPVVPRAPTFGGPPPSSPGAAIPKLPPIPGKPMRGG